MRPGKSSLTTDHTFDVVKRSAILFSSILAVSAKFFRPALYRHLHSHAQMLLSRATGAGECDIGIVKAILVLVFWKNPTDKSAWIKIGTAIRLGYQLGLHASGRGGASYERLEGEAKDARRTWYCECAHGRG